MSTLDLQKISSNRRNDFVLKVGLEDHVPEEYSVLSVPLDKDPVAT